MYLDTGIKRRGIIRIQKARVEACIRIQGATVEERQASCYVVGGKVFIRIQRAEQEQRDVSGYWILDTGYWILDTLSLPYFPTPNPGYPDTPL